MQKIVTKEQLKQRLRQLRAEGKTIVFTNGCFDILHAGHVAYLARARALGDCLVVGLNSDASVKRIKGPERPVNGQDARAAVLGALACVDHVVLFEEDTPLAVIERIRPDVLVKGGDWEVGNIVGADVVEVSPPFDPSGLTAYAGTVMMFEFLCHMAECVAASRVR